MPTKYDECQMTDEERCKYASQAATEAADQALHKMFAIIGVDLDKPESVSEFQQDLRFGRRMRTLADKGMVAAVVVIVTFIVGAVGIGIKQKIMGP